LQDALAHPYLQELHSRAREPVCDAPFDFTFEAGYPEEMPQPLLQHHMFAELQTLRARAATAATAAAAAATGGPVAGVPAVGGPAAAAGAGGGVPAAPAVPASGAPSGTIHHGAGGGAAALPFGPGTGSGSSMVTGP
jgi:hypothetical protein